MALDPEDFKAVMGQWPSGVTVVTTVDEDGPTGMTASSFSSVSLSPPLISICIAKHLPTHARLQKAGAFAVNILSKDQINDGLRFAGMLKDVTDRFEGIDTHTAATGCPLLAGTLGWVDCTIWAQHDGGDHTIFVGEVQAAGVDKTAAPLLYHSRSWGQFADVLAQKATLQPAITESGAGSVVINDAFGASADAPATVEDIVLRVQAAMKNGTGAGQLVLDDAAAAADPLLVRRTLQAIAGLVGRTPVTLQAGAGPMALANVVVGLKSGIHHYGVSEDGGAYVREADLRHMLGRMGVEISEV